MYDYTGIEDLGARVLSLSREDHQRPDASQKLFLL
jgi:hypothetical protein